MTQQSEAARKRREIRRHPMAYITKEELIADFNHLRSEIVNNLQTLEGKKDREKMVREEMIARKIQILGRFLN
ncbi:hypothetical protein BDV59DRAFT_175497 [Aspergillus ambiguus]|uniref:uncharacterized protein n=1 Tax=Aspergillus ambiguus TaxID=176160 RepID=UPI003CCE169A